MESKIKTMRMQRMPGVTVAAFIMGYIDVLNRFSTWVYGGGRTIPIFLLITIVLVIAANNKQQWARVAWSAWIGFGVFCGVACLFVGEWPLLALASIAISIALLVCLWHPKTTDWFEGEKAINTEACRVDKIDARIGEDAHKVAEESGGRLQSKDFVVKATEEAENRIINDEELPKQGENDAEKRAEELACHLFSMLAKMARAHGSITESEVMVAKKAFEKFDFASRRREFCVEVFNNAKDDPNTIFWHAEQFYRAVRFYNRAVDDNICRDVYELLWNVACADGWLQPMEREILEKICNPLHVPIDCFKDNVGKGLRRILLGVQ